MQELGAQIADRYVIESVLKRSPLVDVYRARDTRTGRSVLLKMLSEDLAGEEEAELRFGRQYETLTALAGEHVVVPLDAGYAADGALYVATEFLEGETLRERLARGGPLSVSEATGLVCQACVGLQDAHVRGIVHRDVKPSNLFLARDSQGQVRVKLIDFEMAKARVTMMTRPGQALGSPAYMSPEQMRSAADATPAADVWSLGVSLYELVTGQRPFKGKNQMALVMAVTNDDPVPLSRVDPQIPQAFSQLVQRCLAKSPKDRFASAGQLRDALRAFVVEASPAQLIGFNPLHVLPGPVEASPARPLPFAVPMAHELEAPAPPLVAPGIAMPGPGEYGGTVVARSSERPNEQSGGDAGSAAQGGRALDPRATATSPLAPQAAQPALSLARSGPAAGVTAVAPGRPHPASAEKSGSAVLVQFVLVFVLPAIALIGIGTLLWWFVISTG